MSFKSPTKKCHFAYTSGCTRKNCTYSHPTNSPGFCIEPDCDICNDDLNICLKTTGVCTCNKFHSHKPLIDKIKDILGELGKVINSLKAELGKFASPNIEVATKVAKLVEARREMLDEIKKKRILPSVFKPIMTFKPFMTISEDAQRLDEVLGTTRKRFEKIIQFNSSQIDPVEERKYGREPRFTTNSTNSQIPLSNSSSNGQRLGPVASQTNPSEERKGTGMQRASSNSSKPMPIPNPGPNIQQMQRPMPNNTFQMSGPSSDSNDRVRPDCRVITSVSGMAQRGSSVSKKNSAPLQSYQEKQSQNPSNVIFDSSINDFSSDWDNFSAADDSGDEVDFSASSSAVKSVCHFYLVSGKCMKKKCRLRHEGQRYDGACQETDCGICKCLGLLEFCLNTAKSKNKVSLPSSQYKTIFEKVTSALDTQWNSHIRPIKLILKNPKGQILETLVKIFKGLLNVRVNLVTNVNKIFQSKGSAKEKAPIIDEVLKLFTESNEKVLKYFDENVSEDEIENDDDSQAQSETSSQTTNSKYSSGSVHSLTSNKESKISKNFINGCHFFQLNKCRNLRCKMEHREPVYGVCTIPNCSICQKSLAICDPRRHRGNNCRRVHLQPEFKTAAIKSLNDHWIAVRKTKMQLIEADPTDHETINALIELLTLQLKQRKIFSDRIKDISSLMEYFRAKGDDLNYQRILKDGFNLEIRQLYAGLPAYCVKDQIINEFKSPQNRFCLVIGPTGSGKTTQTPQFILQQLKKFGDQILCVQPRKVAAISLARRVAQELGYKLGEEVGYYVGNKKDVKEPLTKQEEMKGEQLDARLEKIEKMFGPKTRILFVTEAILLKKVLAAKRHHDELSSAEESKKAETGKVILGEKGKVILGEKPAKSGIRFFSNVKAIILDEIHERSLTSDLIYGMMKDFFVKKYPEVKIFLASATVDKELFTEYFNCNSIEIPGRTFPVEIIYKPAYEESYIEGSVAVVREILDEFAAFNPNYMGHILIFLTEVEEMIQVKELLEEEFENYRKKLAKSRPQIDFQKVQMFEEGKDEEEKLLQNNSHQFDPDRFEILLLHGKLTNEEQQYVFAERMHSDGAMKYKIILSTRLAESSVTINGIKVVIDSGFIKEAYYDSRRGLSVLRTDMICQSSANQRAGRAGRTSPGICYRLYSRETFYSLPIGLVPEISRVCLDQALLKIIDFGIDPNKFLYLERPDDKLIEGSLDTLKALCALTVQKPDGSLKLTDEGKMMMAMMTEPKKAKCIIEADKNGVLNSVIAALAVESNSFSLFRYTKQGDKKIYNTEKKILFEGQYQSDLILYMNIFEKWMNVKDTENDKGKKFKHSSKDAKKKWADEHNLDMRSLYSSKRVFQDISKDYFQAKKRFNALITQEETKIDDKKREELVLKSFLAGYLSSVSVKPMKSRGFMNVKENFSFNLHLSSHYARTPLNLSGGKIIFCTQMENSKNGNLAKHVSIVPREWVEKCNSGIREEIVKKLMSDFAFDEINVELPSWAVNFFMRDYRKEIDSWIEENGQNKVSISYPEDQKGLCILTTPMLRPSVEKFFGKLREAFVQKTKRYRQIYEIPGSSCSAVLSDGYKIEEILLSGEYITVAFHGLSRLNPQGKPINFTPEDVASKLKIKQDQCSYIVVNNEKDNTASGNIRFLSKQFASKFYQEAQLNYSKKFEIIPVRETPVVKNTFHSRFIKLLIPLSLSQREAKIIFESAPEAIQALDVINGSYIEGCQIRATQHRTQKNCIMVSGLNSITDEQDIKKKFPDLKILRVNVMRQNTFVGPQGELCAGNSHILQVIEFYRQAARSIVTRYLTPEQVKNLVISEANSISKNQILTLETVLPSRDIAERLFKEYDGVTDCFSGRKLRVKLDNTATIIIKAGIYYVLYQSLVAKALALEDEHDVSIKMNPLEKGQKLYKVKIHSENQDKRRDVAREINTFIKGKIVGIENKDKWKYFTEQMKEFYAELQDRHRGKLHIDWYAPTKTLKIYTPDISLEREIERRIHEMANKSQNLNEIEISLRGYSVKKLVDLLESKKELFDHEIDFTQRLLRIRGQKLDKSKFEAMIQGCRISNRISTQSNCEICADEVDNKSTCFLYCKHRLCKDCANGYIKAEASGEIMKVQCLCPLCPKDTMPVALKDCREIAEMDLADKIFQNHLERFMIDNLDEFRYCYTQGCTDIIAIDKEKQGTCLLCQESYCYKLMSTHKVHPGQTCFRYLESLQDSNQIQKLLDSGKFRISPCCGQLIQKEVGCDHISCKCGQHWCYSCLYLAEGKTWSYDHFNTCKKVAPKQTYLKPQVKADNLLTLIKKGTLRFLQCCNIPFEKTGGCYHITCPKCKKHSCYHCLASYRTERELDLHQARCTHTLPETYLKKYGVIGN